MSVRRDNSQSPRGRANNVREIKMCSVGLEGWKIVSRFNYILFRFPRPARRAISHSIRSAPTPPSTTTTFLPSRVFYVFPPFQFPLEWKSLEHYCNFPSTANGIGFPSSSTPPPPVALAIHIYTKWMDFFPLSSFLSRARWMREIVVVGEFMGKRWLCVCVRKRGLRKNRQDGSERGESE